MNKALKDRRVWIAAIAVAAVLLVILLQSFESGSIELESVAVKQGPFEINLVESGEIRATQSVDIKAPMEWRMDLQIVDMAPEGSMAKVGDLLVQFDVSMLEERLDAAKDRLTSSHAEMKRLSAEQASRMSQLEANLSIAEYSKQIATVQLQQLQFESEVKREDASLALKKAEVELVKIATEIESQKIIDKAARGRVELQIAQGEAEVKELQHKIEKLTLRAPISGMVVYNEIGNWNSRNKVAIGDKPSPGEAVVSIPNLDKMEVVLRVNEMDASKIIVGQKANIRLDAFSEKAFKGRVRDVAKLAQKENWESKVKDFEIVVQIDGNDPILKPGMTAQAQITIGQIDSATYVPIGTVYELDGQTVVFTEDNYPDPTQVTLGARNDEYIVVEEGLPADAHLVWKVPSATYHRLGWDSVVLARRETDKRIADHFAAMSDRGLAFDYDAHRNKTVVASSDSGEVDIESMMAKLKEMRAKGGPIELDPKMMKELQAMMRGKEGKFRTKVGDGMRRMDKLPPKGAGGEGKMILIESDSSSTERKGAPPQKPPGKKPRIDSLRISEDKTSGTTKMSPDERRMMKEMRKGMGVGNMKPKILK